MSNIKKLMMVGASGGQDEYFFAASNVGTMYSKPGPHNGILKTKSNQYVFLTHYNDGAASYGASDHASLPGTTNGRQHDLHYINNDGTFAESVAINFSNDFTYWYDVQGRGTEMAELDDGKILTLNTGWDNSVRYAIVTQLWDQANLTEQHYFYYDSSNTTGTAAEAGQRIVVVDGGSSPEVWTAIKTNNYPSILQLNTTTNPLDTRKAIYWSNQFGGTVNEALLTEANGTYYYGALRSDELYIAQLGTSSFTGTATGKSARIGPNPGTSKQKIGFAGSKLNSNHVYMAFCHYSSYYRSVVFKLDFTNATPTVLWQKQFHLNSNCLTDSLHVDDDDNLFIGCEARGTNPSYNNAPNPLIVSCDKDGNFLWAGSIYQNTGVRSMAAESWGLTPNGSPLLRFGLDTTYSVLAVLPPDGSGQGSTVYDFQSALGINNATVVYRTHTSAQIDWDNYYLNINFTNAIGTTWGTRSGTGYTTAANVGYTIGTMSRHNNTGQTDVIHGL